jgi:hypothetical protein
MTLKEGNKIRIKDEVSSETHRKTPPYFTESMDGLKGKVLTFLRTTPKGYLITEEVPWVLHPDWVTLAESEPEDDFGSAFAQIIKELSEVLTDCDRASILEEAGEILEGDRETDYGDPVANFTRIARIASSILNEDISPEQCVVVMMAVKLSREQYKHKRDNLVDLVAYTEILNRIKELNK